jgi:hypothetical protein
MRLALAVLLVVASASAAAAESAKVSVARERINKAWDERIEKIQNARIEAGCKAEAKKTYTAVHFRKRRAFVRDCIEQAHR